MPPAHPPDPDDQPGSGLVGGVPRRGPARAEPADGAGSDRPSRPEVPALRGPGPAGTAAGRGRGGSLQRHPARRYPAAPSVSVLPAGGRVPAARGARSGRAGDQGDALPRGPQLAGGGGAARGHRGRQAGGGAGGAEGPLRRGEQHRMGPGAGARRRPRGLRPARPEDPLQGGAGGAPRRRCHPPLRAPGHRQLQCRHGAPLYRHRHVHGQSGACGGRHRPVQLPDRLLGQDRTTGSCWWRR